MQQIEKHLISIANKYSIPKIVLYGSRARGDFMPQSDIDLAIYGEFNPQQECQIKNEVDSIPTLLKIDLLFCHRCTNFELLKNIQKEGIVIMSKLEIKKRNLSEAIARLEESIQSYKTTDDDIIRDGMIQRFEFTIELAWKTLRVYLIEQGFIDLTSPKIVLRESFSAGLIQNQEVWLQMLQDRNQTSHMYDENIANEIAERIVTSYFNAFERLLTTI